MNPTQSAVWKHQMILQENLQRETPLLQVSIQSIKVQVHQLIPLHMVGVFRSFPIQLLAEQKCSSVPSVGSVLTREQNSLRIREVTLERGHFPALNVEKLSPKGGTCSHIENPQRREAILLFGMREMLPLEGRSHKARKVSHGAEAIFLFSVRKKLSR